MVGLPDVRGRVEILKHHMADVQADVEVDPSIIARGCPGMSGADLQNLVNQVKCSIVCRPRLIVGRGQGVTRWQSERATEAL